MQTIRSFYAALSIDDAKAVKQLTTPAFYAFDGGKRFTGEQLSKLIADAHKNGRVIQWNIGSIDTRIDCHLAFAAWQNNGAAGMAGAMEPRRWLESAILLRHGEGWVIDFLHATPVSPGK